jgi:hypothetical protein
LGWRRFEPAISDSRAAQHYLFALSARIAEHDHIPLNLGNSESTENTSNPQPASGIAFSDPQERDPILRSRKKNDAMERHFVS